MTGCCMYYVWVYCLYKNKRRPRANGERLSDETIKSKKKTKSNSLRRYSDIPNHWDGYMATFCYINYNTHSAHKIL